MKQTKRIVVALLCLCLVLTSIFAFTACKNKDCEHSDTEWKVVKEATATENGQKNEVCKDCDEVLNTETIPATGTTDPTPAPAPAPNAPTGLALNGTTLTWNAVADATSYVVKIGENTYTVTTTTYDIAALNLTAGSYTAAVRAVNANGSSAFSGTISFNYPNSMALGYSNKTVSWAAVEGATTYEVKINDNEPITTDATTFAVTFTKSGDNTIAVRATGAADWVSINVAVYKVTYDSLSIDGGEVVEYLATGDAMTLPTGNYTNVGYDFSGWYSARTGGTKYDNGAIFTATADTVVYGGWNARSYTLNIKTDGYGVTNIDAAATLTVTYDSNFTLPVPVLNTDGADMFLGWFSDNHELSTRYTDEYGNSINVAKFTENTNVYPVFISNVLEFVLQNDDTYEVTAGANFDKVENITIPVTYQGKTVSGILENAFDSRKRLVSINIPNTIQLIGVGAFNANTNLKAINVYEVEGAHDVIFSSADGALIRSAMGSVTLEVFPRAKTGSFTVPAGVTELRSRVFLYSNISEIIISKDVLTIYERAFYNCVNLKSVVFEGGRAADVTLKCGDEGGFDSIFFHTTNIESITLPAKIAAFDYQSVFNQLTKLTNISVEENGSVYASVDGMFTNGIKDTILYAPLSVKGNYTIPDEIVHIGENAFRGRTGLKSVTVPMHVESIGNNAFYQCTGVTTVTIEGGRFRDLSIGSSAFAGCKLNSVDFVGNNGTTLEMGAITIGSSAFAPSGTVALESVNFGKNVNIKKIGDSAFSGQSKLANLVFGENAYVGEIGSSAFQNTAIKTLNIPASVTKIGNSAFNGCSKLTTITFNEGGVGDITFGSSAFANCSAVTSIYLPSTVQEFEGTVFNGCNSLSEIIVDANNPNLVADNGVLYNANKSTLIYYPRGLAVDTDTLNALPWNSITTIGAAAFSGHTALASFEIKKGVTAIGEGAFQNCTALTTLTYETGADANATLTIGKNAFSGCNKLASAAVPAYTTVIGDAAFKSTKFSTFAMPASLTKIGVDAFTSNTALTSINIPANVTSIGAGAFQSCSNLATVTVEESNTLFTFVNSGTKGAFQYCTKLKSIDLKNRATNIGSYTFASTGITSATNILGSNVTKIETGAFKSSKITSLTIPANITSIGNYAFSTMTSLTSISFAEGTEALTFGVCVFEKCSGLTTINFPARTTHLDGEVYGHDNTSLKGMINVSNMPEFFAGCSALKTITVTPGENNYYVSIDGVLYKATNGDSVPTTLLYCPPKNPATTLTVPKTVTLVENRSLFNLENVKTITFENYAETEVDADGNTLYNQPLLYLGRGQAAEEKVGSNAYAVIGGTSNSLTTLNLPSHLARIGSYAISKTTEILDLNFAPNGVPVAIGQYAFNNARIVEYVFPGVSEMATWAFTGAFSSGSFTNDELNTLPFVMVLGDNSTLTTIPSQAFNGAKFETFEFPASVVETASSAFYVANRLKTVTFAEGSQMKTIGGSTFGVCSSLTSVDFSNATKLETLGTNLFQNCTSLITFTFPDNIKAVGGVLFEGCSNLTTVTLGKSFSPEMFYSQDTAGYTWNIFGSRNNYAVTSLAEIKVADGNEFFKAENGVLYNADKTVVYCFPMAKDPTGYTLPTTITNIGHFAFRSFKGTTLTLPAGVTVIGDNAFEESALTSITIGANVTSIGNYAFRCINTSKAALTVVNFENNNIKMTEIGDYAFTGQAKVTAFNNLPDSIATIGINAFQGCSSITSIILPGALTAIPDSLFMNCYNLTNVKIQQNVQSIGVSAFASCGITTVDIPATVTTIGEKAFYQSGVNARPYLTKVTFTDDSSLVTIGAQAFEGCTSLTSINLPDSLTELPAYKGSSAGGNTNTYTYSNTFKNCVNLTSISIPNVAVIPDSAFEGCSSLTSIELSDTLYSIGAKAFYNTAFESFVIPASVTEIGASAFENCSALTSVTFDANSALEELGSSVTANDAIFKNTALTSITLPASLTMIGGHVFENTPIASTNLKQLEALEEIGNYAFANCDELTEVALGTGVTYLGDYAFYDCDKLTTPSLNFGLEHMGALAFGLCELITDGYIPATVETLSGNPYAGCPAVDLLRVDPDNILLNIDENGSIYDEDKTVLYYYASNAATTTPTIPSTVTTVAPGAFAGSNITSITIPSKITYVVPYMFYGCEDLTTVTITSGIKAIQDYAFYGCSKLNNVTIPASATVTGWTTTTNNTKDVITTLGNYAFANCSSLSNVNFESTTNHYVIGTHLFENCTAMTEIKLPTAYQISDEQGVALQKIVGNGIFANINTTTGAVSVRYQGMKQVIPAYMFAGTGIVNAVIPSNVVYLETDGVFMNCAKLETVTFAASALKYKFIGNYMFYNCDSLVEIEIPNSNSANPLANKIGYTFAECDNLERVILYYKPVANPTMPNNAGMFMNCKNLKEVILYNVSEAYTGGNDNDDAGDNEENTTPSTPTTPGFGTPDSEGSGDNEENTTPSTPTTPGFGTPDSEGAGDNEESTTPSTPTTPGFGTPTTPGFSTPTSASNGLKSAQAPVYYGFGTATNPGFSTPDSEGAGDSEESTTPSTPTTPDSEGAGDSEESTTPSTPTTPGFSTPDSEGAGDNEESTTPSTPTTPGFGTPDSEEDGPSTPSTPTTPGFGTPDSEEDGPSTPSTPTTPGFGTPDSEGDSEDDGGNTGGSTTPTTPLYNQGYLGYIGNNWFSGCESLEEITIMVDAYIGDNAFEGCTSLKEVNFYDPNAKDDEETNNSGNGDSEGAGDNEENTTPSTPTTPGFGTPDSEGAGDNEENTTPSTPTTPGFGTPDSEGAGDNEESTTPSTPTTPGFSTPTTPGFSTPTNSGSSSSTFGFGTATTPGFGTSDSEEDGPSTPSTPTTPGFGTPDSEEDGPSTPSTPTTPGISTPTTPGFGTPDSEEGGSDDGEDNEGANTPVEKPVVTLKYLGNNAFKGCTALTSIDLPGIPKNAGSNVFEGWTADQTINLSNTEAELAEQIENGLFDGCEATINYKD